MSGDLSRTQVLQLIPTVLTLTVAVGVQERPSAAPQTGPWDKKFVLFGDPTFAEASSSLAALVFAFCGTPGFFGIISEMRDPRLYTRAVCICQSFLTAMYIVRPPSPSVQADTADGGRGRVLLLRPVRRITGPGQRGPTAEEDMLWDRHSRPGRQFAHRHPSSRKVPFCDLHA